jgi:selenocysteine-specific elongation factor
VILGTAGHIDHGKTTLVRALTGVDTDRLPEEKRRGITIELGFAPLVLDGIGTVGVVDVPGHEGFVRTMVAGATGIDLALVVVAADEGVMPQTREHLAILALLGVDRGVVALTKADLVDEEWLALATDDVRGALAGTPLETAPVIPVSAVTGAGIDALRSAIAAAAHSAAARDAADLFRMPIDRAFSVRGTGTVVTGTVWSGTLARDATVRVLPAGHTARVRALQSHGTAVGSIGPGTRAAVALAGVDLDAVGRGAVLVTDSGWQPTTILRADVVLLPDAPTLGPRTRVRLHLGTVELGARIVAVGGELVAGDARPARVVLDGPVVARAGDRFVLRSPSPLVTIGGGTVRDPLPPARRARPWPADVATPEAALALLVAEAAGQGIAAGDLPLRLGLAPAAAARLAVDADGSWRGVHGRLYDRQVVDGIAGTLLRLVDEAHVQAPLEPGISTQSIRTKLPASPELVVALLREAVAAGRLELEGGVVRRGGWKPALGAGESAAFEGLARTLEAAGREPPSASELGVAHGPSTAALLRLLERERRIVQVEPDRYYSSVALADLMSALRAHMEPGRVYNPSELREVLGVSRKFLIPLLEYADRTAVTDRRADGRVIRGT